MAVSPLDRVRARVEAFREAEAAHDLAALEGRDAPAESAVLGRARRALGTGENREDLEEARSLGLLDPETEALLLGHVADAAGSEAASRVGGPLSVRGDATVVFEGREHTLLALAAEALRGPDARTVPRVFAIAARFDRDRAARLEAIAAADEATLRVLARLGKVEHAELEARASRFLDATDATLEELGARARHARGLREGGPASLALALRPSAARTTPAAATTALLAPLALDGALSRAVRLGTHELASLDAAVTVRSGSPILVSAPSLDVGLAGRAAVVAAAVHALALSLGPRGPFERAREASSSTLALALGTTLAAGLAVPAALRRSLGEEERDAHRDATATALGTLLAARVLATRLLSLRDRPGEEETRVRGARALGLREPLASSEVAWTSTLTAAELRGRTAATLDGLAAPVALRERFDVDWPRNPRMEVIVRAASQLGPALASSRWLAELGGAPEHANGFGRDLAG